MSFIVTVYLKILCDIFKVYFILPLGDRQPPLCPPLHLEAARSKLPGAIGAIRQPIVARRRAARSFADAAATRPGHNPSPRVCKLTSGHATAEFIRGQRPC